MGSFPWIDIGGGLAAVAVGGALLALLDPRLVRDFLARRRSRR